MTTRKIPGDTLEARAVRLHNSKYGNLPELTAARALPYTDLANRYVLLVNSAGRLIQVYRVTYGCLRHVARHNWPMGVIRHAA